MSLAIVIKGSEGLVLAADSRVTLEGGDPKNVKVMFNFDNATKLLTFAEQKWIGVVTFGDAVIGTKTSNLRTAKSLVPELEATLPKERLSVHAFSQLLSDFFRKEWETRMPANHPGQGMTFIVGGFDEGKPYSSVYLLKVPGSPTPEETTPDDFGITWGGQLELASRILRGYDPRIIEIATKELGMKVDQVDAFTKALAQLQLKIPFQVLPLQDCIDLAVFLIRTTATAQNLSIEIRGVGGAIDVAVITQREGLCDIQRKELVGEMGTQHRREI